VTHVQTAHTADLDANALEAARALLYAVLDDMTEDDWEHSLGGMHALVWEDSELVGHASVIQRRLLYAGRALRTGYVEAVAVRADRRGRGHGARMMDVLERVIRSAYDVGALGSTDEAAAYYAGRGWQLWRGPSYAMTPAGVQRTEDDDGGIYVLPVAHALDVYGDIACDYREGDCW